MEQLDTFLTRKRNLADSYSDFFEKTDIHYVKEPPNTCSNYWLNTIILKDNKERIDFLEYTNRNGIMTRPSWELMTELPMFRNSIKWNIGNSIWLSERLVNLPSSVII